MLDSNGTKLKPKKSQVHGMDIWARCHTKNALCGISYSKFPMCNLLVNVFVPQRLK
jgi:hypothetical protein